jgi:predicted RNase H-like HicB family nuclease
MTYGIIVHRAGSSWNAYVPELEGVCSAADTRVRVIESIAEAIPFHLRELAKAGDVAPDLGASEALTLAIL